MGPSMRLRSVLLPATIDISSWDSGGRSCLSLLMFPFDACERADAGLKETLVRVFGYELFSSLLALVNPFIDEDQYDTNH